MPIDGATMEFFMRCLLLEEVRLDLLRQHDHHLGEIEEVLLFDRLI